MCQGPNKGKWAPFVCPWGTLSGQRRQRRVGAVRGRREGKERGIQQLAVEGCPSGKKELQTENSRWTGTGEDRHVCVYDSGVMSHHLHSGALSPRLALFRMH